MLGLDSNIDISGNISLESRCSKNQQILVQSLQINSIDPWVKNHPSTNITSNISEKANKIRSLKNRIQKIQSQKDSMHQKLGNYVKIIEREIQRKSEHNKQIQNKIMQCKKQLQQSQTDIATLTRIIQNKKKTTNSSSPAQKFKRTHIRNMSSKVGLQGQSINHQNKSSGANNTNKLVSQQKITNTSPKPQSKSPSSRLFKLAQQKRIAPNTQGTKTDSGKQTQLSPRTYKKVKSPFKF